MKLRISAQYFHNKNGLPDAPAQAIQLLENMFLYGNENQSYLKLVEKLAEVFSQKDSYKE